MRGVRYRLTVHEVQRRVTPRQRVMVESWKPFGLGIKYHDRGYEAFAVFVTHEASCLFAIDGHGTHQSDDMKIRGYLSGAHLVNRLGLRPPLRMN